MYRTILQRLGIKTREKNLFHRIQYAVTIRIKIHRESTSVNGTVLARTLEQFEDVSKDLSLVHVVGEQDSPRHSGIRRFFVVIARVRSRLRWEKEERGKFMSDRPI